MAENNVEPFLFVDAVSGADFRDEVDVISACAEKYVLPVINYHARLPVGKRERPAAKIAALLQNHRGDPVADTPARCRQSREAAADDDAGRSSRLAAGHDRFRVERGYQGSGVTLRSQRRAMRAILEALEMLTRFSNTGKSSASILSNRRLYTDSSVFGQARERLSRSG